MIVIEENASIEEVSANNPLGFAYFSCSTSYRACNKLRYALLILTFLLSLSNQLIDRKIGVKKTVSSALFFFRQLKKKVAEKFSTDLETVCLIFAGKILKDTETLETHSEY